MVAIFKTGDLLDTKYRILDRLGVGGFGEVYLANDELLDRRVAIKLLRRRDPSAQSDIIHEMRSLNQLNHPAVVRFFHHFSDEESLCLVMEYCAGGSLRAKMAKPAPVHVVMQWGKALADTLKFVHEKGLVHHDIKPDNILFTAEGVIKIGDFGIANRNLGTERYVAPEMWLGHVDPRDVRIDVYALGITLLETVKGSDPFHGLSPADTLRAKVKHDFIPSECERWVQDVLGKATHPTPELRFQSMQEFLEGIESKHVSYIFQKSRIQAHALAAKAEKQLAHKQITAASKSISQALYACPDCVSALVAAGRRCLFVNHISDAKQFFDRALSVNPRVNIQKELGWVCVETSNWPQAISLLTDHIQRYTADYEAFNLLLECFYRTGRYEAGLQVAELMRDEKVPSRCFENNGFLCAALLARSDAEVLVGRATSRADDPFQAYNLEILSRARSQLKTLGLFENYRFGLQSRRENVLSVTIDGILSEYTCGLITVGRLGENRICVGDVCVSRRHCVLVNYANDVWVYDFNSSQGVFVEGKRIVGKAYLEGVQVVRLGNTELTVCSRRGLLV